MSNTDFEKRILYDQEALTEDGVSVLQTVYAALWTYPGALSPTTARIRTVCVYSNEGAGLISYGGTIEKWTNQTWALIDEYGDTREEFYDIEEFRNRLITMAESFLMGVPLISIDSGYSPNTTPPIKKSNDKPDISVIDFNKRKDASGIKKTKSGKKDNTKNKKSDQNDFDWI